MVKLAPMLEEIPEDICVSGHERSGSHDRKLHQAFPLSRGGGIGPESITLKSEMANHNSRVSNMTRWIVCPRSLFKIMARASHTKKLPIFLPSLAAPGRNVVAVRKRKDGCFMAMKVVAGL